MNSVTTYKQIESGVEGRRETGRYFFFGGCIAGGGAMCYEGKCMVKVLMYSFCSQQRRHNYPSPLKACCQSELICMHTTYPVIPDPDSARMGVAKTWQSKKSYIKVESWSESRFGSGSGWFFRFYISPAREVPDPVPEDWF
jgi:hypothetical protein